MTCAGMVSLTPSSPPFVHSTEQLLQPNSSTSNSPSPRPHCSPLFLAFQTHSTCWLADVLFVCVIVCLMYDWYVPCSTSLWLSPSTVHSAEPVLLCSPSLHVPPLQWVHWSCLVWVQVVWCSGHRPPDAFTHLIGWLNATLTVTFNASNGSHWGQPSMPCFPMQYTHPTTLHTIGSNFF